MCDEVELRTEAVLLRHGSSLRWHEDMKCKVWKIRSAVFT